MGIFSRFRRSSRPRPPVDEPDAPPSLVRYRYEDPALEDIERAAAADVEAVERDEKYFGGQDSGGSAHDDL